MRAKEAFTFDDISLVPNHAEILPEEIDLKTKFSKNVPLNIPLVSPPMDTVTGSRLAIAIAEEGGMGIIHRCITIEEQAEEVRRVKRHRNIVISKPYTLSPWNTVKDAEKLMAEKGISGIPIINISGKLEGIFTKRDYQYALFFSRDAEMSKVMTKAPLISGIPGMDLKEARALMLEKRVEKLPLVDDKFHLAGLITKKDLQKIDKYPMANVDSNGQLYVGAAVGATGDFRERAIELVSAGCDAIVVDSSHGDSKNVFNALASLSGIPGMIDIIVGNIVTVRSALALIDKGAASLKIGIGSGSICTTRIVTGCGVPQFSAVLEIAEKVGDVVPLISDGGVQYSGDITKAIFAGASSVMSGYLLAGAEESLGEKFEYQRQLYKRYRGMGSLNVMKTSGRYLAKGVPEGVEGAVSFGGSFAEVARQLVGGLKQGMGYLGCENIFKLRTGFRSGALDFVRLTKAGVKESHVHGIMITAEASNYHTTER